MVKKLLLGMAGLFILFWVLVLTSQPDDPTQSDASDVGAAPSDGGAAGRSSGLITATVDIGFDACKSRASATAAGLGATLIGIVDSDDMYVARIPTSDGSVLVTCSAADGRMAVTKSPR